MRIPKLRSPIVLVHGIFGFDQVRLGCLTLVNYFPGIPELLRAAGNRVLIPRLSPTGGIAERAEQLKQFLDREMPAEPVHILGHSMGGLDARYMISRLDMGGRVLSLTTLGTPHRGTTFADWGIRRLERLVKPLLRMIGLPTQGFYDLTTERCQAFNAEVPDVPGVRYFSVAGRHDGHFLSPEWLLPYNIVLDKEGPNDGVVSLASASYGESVDVWEADHLNLVNWVGYLPRNRGPAGEPAARYGRLLCRLADAGF
jgi:triacylglycerol lipase